jgi:peptidoglycan/xylan/chitin deacetylase (PgdA/CDA1 family)
MFASQPTLTYTDNAKTKSANNWTFAGNPVNILFPGTRTFLPTNPGAMLTIIDDDGHSKFYTDLLPIIKSKKVPISTAIYNTSVGVAQNTMTWEQVAECYENGAEILSHSYDHADSEQVAEMTLEEIQHNDQMAKNELLVRGYSGGKFIVYAGTTQTNDNVVKAAKNVYSCGINSTGNEMNFIDTLDPYHLKRYRIEVDYSYTSTDLDALIDTCKTDGGWMIWMIHTSGNAWNSAAASAIGDAIDYAVAQGVQIVTVEAGCRKMGIT